MKKPLVMFALALAAVLVNADSIKVTYDDLDPLRPEGGKNEFWDTSNRALMPKYVATTDESGETITVVAWSASAATVSTTDYPATFMPRWYSEGESSMGSYEIRTPPLTILLY